MLAKAVIAASITQTCEFDAKTDIRITQDGEEVEGIRTVNGRVRFHAEGGKRYVISAI